MNIRQKLQKIEDLLVKKEGKDNPDMHIEVVTCNLIPNCPMKDFKESKDNRILYIEGHCQHRLTTKDELREIEENKSSLDIF